MKARFLELNGDKTDIKRSMVSDRNGALNERMKITDFICHRRRTRDHVVRDAMNGNDFWSHGF